MAGWISFILVAIASMIAIAESRVVPTNNKPTSVMLDPNGSPIIFLREKRTVARPYPHRAMMFTGYYRPIRRTGNSGQATGLFAQGNAVSGEAFFGGMHAPHLKDGPEPIEEPEVSSAHAHAAPTADEERHHNYHHQNEVHRHEEDQYHEHHHHEDEKHHHHHQDSSTSQEHHEQEEIPTTEIAQTPEEPITTTEVSVTRPKWHHTKKPHKTPVDDEDEDEDEEDEDDDQPPVPFVPFKGNRRRQKIPHLNNFFPMIFSFPRLATRAGSSGSVPGTITAIANSYSTGKGGVASSVATAYGGSSAGKKRRQQPYEK
ncbi:sarcoplasmic reticulum histidine-rich calcium-binding protein-like [Nylanderia fulva]|uniref:sarcoplasmic reticulum histidine-rich calcium-binding protein-like n=1 Tax=Nylanderia fulva TaxID=613905 RepID=UPI0010FB3379|nr:sarcoplasmic reticulum histidine-rich calcium-binding protein-like [Nylanderia fulva]